MAKSPELNDVTNLANAVSALAQLALNNEKIEQAFENTLSLDGSTPNSMAADLDMDGNDILNVGSLGAERLLVEGSDIIVTVTGLRDQAQAYRDQAGSYATDAAISAASAEDSSVVAQAAADDAQDLVEAAGSGFVGYQNGMAYDFGFITDSTTYFDFDWGLITDPVTP